MKLIQKNLANNQYYRQVFEKLQIFLHHTAGADNGPGVLSWWGKDPKHIATCVVIERDGDIWQGFSSKYWAYHLGLKGSVFRSLGLKYKSLDRTSIGIELTSWGGLVKKGQKYYHYLGGEVPEEEVIKLSYKQYKYYHKYSADQIQAVKELLILWNEKYGIPLKYNKDIFELCPRAFKGEPGVYTHNSVRTDKVDIYPDPDLIAMLKKL